MADNETRKILFQLELDNAKALPTIKEVRDALKATNTEFENTQKGTEAYDALEVKTQALKEELKRLTDATKESSNALGGVNSAAKFVDGSMGALKQSIKAAKTELDNTKIGTEAYAQAEAKLNGLLQQEIEIRSKQPSLFKERIKQAFDESGAIKDLGAALISMGDKAKVSDAIATAGANELKTAIKELRDEAAKQGGLNTLIGKELIAKAGEAKDKLDDINKSINALASDTGTLDALTQGARGVAAGFTLAQGASALFGNDQKALQETLVKVQASMAVLNSVTEIGNLIQKDSAISLKASALAHKIYNVVVGEGAIAMKVFRAALAATGIGLLIILIVELITHFKEVKEKVTGFIDSLGIVGDVIKALATPFIFIYDLIKKLGQAMGLINSDAANAAEKGLLSNKKLGDIVAERYDREIKLASAAGKAVEALERQKLIASNLTNEKLIANLETLKRENGKLTDDQVKQLETLKAAVLNNQTDITAITLKEQKKRSDALEADAIKALQLELRKQTIGGGTGTGTQIKIAQAERDAAIKAAQEKGESTANIEAEYQIKVGEIYQAGATKRLETEFKFRSSLLGGMAEGHDKEIAAENLALDQKLAAVKGNTLKEEQIRGALVAESAKKLQEIDQKEAERRLQQQKNIQDALNAAGLADARNDQERFIAHLKIVNDQSVQELTLLKTQRDKELENKTLSEQDRLAIIAEYNAKELQVLAEHNAEVLNLTQENEFAKAQALIAAKQLSLDASAPENELAAKMALLDAEYQAEVLNAEKTGADTTQIAAKYEKAKQLLTAQTTDATLSVTQGMLSNISSLLKKGSTEYKVIASAQALIDTYKAATAAYAAGAAVPVAGIVLGPLAAALAVAAGLANVAKINSTKEFAYGGPTFALGGGIPKPTLGLIGEAGPEWVAPNWMLSHPTTAPVLKGLENYRQTKTPLPFADGGFTASYFSAPTDDRAGLGSLLSDVVSRLPRPVVDVQTVIDKTAEVLGVQEAAKI